ncbi:MAG: hypothetical protein CNLJKLNK_00799 [Holosporales bacterium]
MYKLFFLLFSVAYGVEGYSYSPFEMELGELSPSCTVQLSKREEYAFKIKAMPNTRNLIIYTPCPVSFSFDGFEEHPEKNTSSDEDLFSLPSVSNASISNASVLHDASEPSSHSTTSQRSTSSQNTTTTPNHKTKRVSFLHFMTDHFEKQERERKKISPVKMIQKEISKIFTVVPKENQDHKLISLIIPKNVDVTLHPIYDRGERITFGPIILKDHE